MTSQARRETGQAGAVLVLVLVLLVVLVVGAATYVGGRFLTDTPVEYADSAEHFKYGSLGSEREFGMPYWVWRVRPERRHEWKAIVAPHRADRAAPLARGGGPRLCHLVRVLPRGVPALVHVGGRPVQVRLDRRRARRGDPVLDLRDPPADVPGVPAGTGRLSSVPNLRDLLEPRERRACVFYRGYDVYDPGTVGFDSQSEEARRIGSRFDTAERGNGNQEHLYGTDLSPRQKEALLEYLKTL